MDDAGFGFDVLDDFERFSQVDDVFSRSFWDEAVRDDATERFYATYRRPLARWRKANGFTQKDYAVRNASWHVTDIFAEMREDDDRRDGFLDDLSMLRDGPDEKVALGTPSETAAELKHVARTFGADLVAVTAYDHRWTYTERFSAATGAAKPNDLPGGLDHVVVIGQAMDHDLIRTAPSALSGTATGLGYSRDALVLLATAQYIRNLGYRAVPSMNDTALAIPYAIAAGLGEYGRHGLLITPEFGPRVRIGKIFTDLPLAHDRPRRFGVREFCDACDRCSAACPARAIPAGEPVPVALNRSGIRGVRKWSVDGEACFGYWSKINSDCAICVRVCPFTRDYSKPWNRWWRRLASSPLRAVALRLDDRLGGGRRLRPGSWWARAVPATRTVPSPLGRVTTILRNRTTKGE
ncbi:MAG: 4Fe-4S dicluster domain-containing protein [Acidimicrobiia bacterium]|nr:4Fe-4S dicluster domain-containing protein [Acidimicrobiia bacterium]